VVFAFIVQTLLVRAASRYKFYRSQKTITGYKTVGEHWSSVAVQTISEPEIYHGAKVKLRAAARIRMQGPLEICLDAGAKAKTMTNLFTLLTVLAAEIMLKTIYYISICVIGNRIRNKELFCRDFTNN
jgi:hypothetical protein